LATFLPRDGFAGFPNGHDIAGASGVDEYGCRNWPRQRIAPAHAQLREQALAP
jgi:hypothetical protein